MTAFTGDGIKEIIRTATSVEKTAEEWEQLPENRQAKDLLLEQAPKQRYLVLYDKNGKQISRTKAIIKNASTSTLTTMQMYVEIPKVRGAKIWALFAEDIYLMMGANIKNNTIWIS